MEYIGSFFLFLCVSMATAQQPMDLSDSLNKNKTIIVTSILTPPYMMMAKKVSTGNSRFVGYIPDLVKRIAARLDMKYEIRLVKDGRYGYLNEDGTWNGMIGEVIRGEADIAAAPLTVTSVRERVVDFTKAFMRSGIVMVMNKRLVFRRKTQSQDLGVLLHTFSSEVWMCLVIVAVSVWICCVLLRRFHPDERNEGDEITLLNAVAIETKGIFTKNTHPRSCARTLLISSSYLFWFVAIVLYVVSLFYFLGLPQRGGVKFASVEDVVKDPEVQFGTTRAGSTMNFFKTSRIQFYARVWERMSSDPQSFVSTLSEGLEKVRKTNYAFFGQSPILSVDRKPCDLVQVGGLLNSVGYALATPIGSNMRNYFNLALLALQENGELAVLKARWWRRGECGTPTVVRGGRGNNSDKPLSIAVLNIGYLYLPMLLLFIAAILSLLMTLFRIFGSNIFKKRNENVNESQLPLNDKDAKEIGTIADDTAPETVEITA